MSKDGLSAVVGSGRLHRQERKEDILRGAAKAFVKQGYAATNLEDIAEAAGISRSLLYRHYDSKQAIYLAILENTIARLRGNQPVVPAIGFGNKLEALIETAQAYPEGFVLLFRHAPHESIFQDTAEANGLLRQNFIESNLVEAIPNSQRRRFTAGLLRDTIIGVLLTWIDSGQPEPERLNSLLADVIESIIKSMQDK
jgi:AcrR family transcriptional regulator